MKKLHNPIFPCNLQESKTLDLTVLDFEKRIEAVPFTEGYGIFNGRLEFWATDEEKELIRQRAKDYKEYQGVRKDDSWKALSPIDLEIELTSICNQRCIHCGVSCTSTGTSFEFSTLSQLLSDFRKNGGQKVLFTGGEPLLYHDFRKVLEFCKDINVKNYGVVTNGTLINRDKAEFLSQFFDYVTISLHGHTPEIHDGITQSKGSFEKVENAVKYLRNNGVDVLLYFTIMEENFESIPKMFDLVKDWGCDGIRFKPIHLDGRAQVKKPISTEGKHLLSRYIERLSEIKKVNIISSEIYRKDYLENPAVYKFFGCNALRKVAYVGANGDVYPCNLMLDKTVGNVYTDSLIDIWNGENAQEIRKIPCDCNRDILRNCGGICKAK